MTVIPERVAALDTITLDQGGHGSFQSGHCFNEAAAWLAGEPHSDAPSCVSPVLRRYTMRLNDRWDDKKRQTLLPYLVRVIGTGGDGKDELREQIATQYLTEKLLGPWLRLAGMDDELAKLDQMAAMGKNQRRDLLWSIREACWAVRARNVKALQEQIKTKLLEQLKDQPADAAAAADAAADAAAAAAAAAAAVAVAAAVAAAAAVAVSSKPSWQSSYTAAYEAARAYYREHPLSVSEEIAELGASQDGIALELLEAMIDPEAA